MKKKLLIVLLVVLVLTLSIFLVACGDNSDKDNGSNNGGTTGDNGNGGGTINGGTDYDNNDNGGTTGGDDGEDIEEPEDSNVTITYDSDGGTAVENETILKGDIAIGPMDDPEKEGYVFIGWFLGEKEFDFDTEINSDITLKAKWQKEYSYLYFGLNEDEGSFSVSILNEEYSGELVIPSEYMLKPVTIIENLSSEGITSVVIPASIITIDEYAFGGCSKLESVTFEQGSKIETIAEGTFINCRELTTINIPESVTMIGEGAFAGCLWLKSVVLPEGLKEIGGFAFEDSDLESVIIPKSVISIGSYAFDCFNLTTINLEISEAEYNALISNGWESDWCKDKNVIKFDYKAE